MKRMFFDECVLSRSFQDGLETREAGEIENILWC